MQEFSLPAVLAERERMTSIRSVFPKWNSATKAMFLIRTPAIPLGATVTINGSNGDSFTVTADGDGTFALCDKEIKNNTTYDVEVKYEGYIVTGDRFSTIGLSNSTTMTREFR